MAELVQLHLERGLGELEEMERIGLFSREEICKIVKRRKALEYGLRKTLIRREDFLKYIKYEMCLLRLIKKRRQRLFCDSKKNEIDKSIAKKINNLYKTAVSRFSADEKLWLEWIRYCKRMKWRESVNSVYMNLLKAHSKKPELFVSAAQWEMDQNSSPDNARKILQRGILINPKSEIIWREYFKMELKYVDLIKKRQKILEMQNIKDDSEQNDAVLNGAVAKVVYDKAIEEIPNVEFALSFIQLCLEFDFTSKIIDYILNDVQETFPNKEEALDALAKKPLINVQKEIEKGKKIGMPKKVVLKKLYEEIHSKYNEAVKTLPTEKMWNFYLDFIFDVLRSAKENKKVKLQMHAINKMEEAANANCLHLDYYIHWIEMLFDKGEKTEALSISLSAARKWNKVPLWVKCVTLHIRHENSYETIYPLLLEAFFTLNDKESLPIWDLAIEWLTLCEPKKLFELFEHGINKDKEVSLPLKEKYLQVTAIKNGNQAAHDLYNRFKKMGPLSLSIIQRMILIERGQLNPSIDLIEKYFQDAISRFGATSIDIWLEYINFEIKYARSPMSCGKIHWQAMKTLEPELVKSFQERVTKYCTGSGLSADWELAS